MRISLAVGMVPRTGAMGAHVKVPSGKWKVKHNTKDSQLTLVFADASELDVSDMLTFTIPTSMQLKVAKGGTERFILAYLEAA